MSKVKRSLFATYINTGSYASPTYVLLGEGITNAGIAYNPKTLEETYIHEDSAHIEVESYAPSMDLEMTIDDADAAFTYLDGIRKVRGILADAESDIVNVWMYETPSGDSYPAERQKVSVSFNEFGGEGGTATKMSLVLSYRGDLIDGDFDVVLKTFTPTP